MVTIRAMAETDAIVVADLAHQLGYPAAEPETANAIARLGSHAVALVATDGDHIVGWVEAYETRLLYRSAFAEIGGLVVDQDMRGAGAGRALMTAVEDWAVARGLTEVRLRSNVVRAAAHEFYRRLGYDVEKTSYTFSKQVGARP